MTRGLAAAALGLAAVMTTAACGGSSAPARGPASPTPSPSASPEALSARGQRALALEGLLRKTFKSSSVCTVAAHRQTLDFVAGSCAPLATYNPYFFTFTNRPATTYRLTQHRPGDLGNYSRPVRLGGKYVLCANGRYLVELADAASFTLECVRPL
jgi:hypothetical protein